MEYAILFINFEDIKNILFYLILFVVRYEMCPAKTKDLKISLNRKREKQRIRYICINMVFNISNLTKRH